MKKASAKAKKAKDGKKSSKKSSKEGAGSSSVDAAPVAAQAPFSAEFDYGMLFERNVHSNADGAADTITREQFLKMMPDLRLPTTTPPEAAALTSRQRFNAGALFARYDPKGSGTIDKAAFQKILEDLGTASSGGGDSAAPSHVTGGIAVRDGGGNTTAAKTAMPTAIDGTGNTAGFKAAVPTAYPAAYLVPLDQSQTAAPTVPPTTQTSPAVAAPPLALGSMPSRPLEPPHGPSSGPPPPQHLHLPIHGVNPMANVHYPPPLPPPAFLAEESAELRRDYTHLQGQLQATLHGRRDALVRQLQLAASAETEVEATLASIEREIAEDADATIGRLRAEGGRSLRAIHQHAELLRGELLECDHFYSLATGPRPLDALRHRQLPPPPLPPRPVRPGMVGLPPYVSPELGIEGQPAGFTPSTLTPLPVLPIGAAPHAMAMLEFVRGFTEIRGAAQRIASKPVETLATVGVDGASGGGSGAMDVAAVCARLPREVQRRKERLAATDATQQSLAVKDEMIWMLVREREGYERQKQATLDDVEELSRATASEISEWMTLSDRVSEELNIQIAALKEENRVLRERNASLTAQLGIEGADGMGARSNDAYEAHAAPADPAIAAGGAPERG